jgi:two-component system chemotaxis response regulator CheY
MAKTVMIVDDSSSLRQVVCIVLKGAGYEVLEAADGDDAVAQLDGRKVDLIISDVNMPRMDGITLVKEIKKLPDYKFTPIMMLTTVSDEDKKREGQAAGAKAWLVKPFVPAQMLTAVMKVLPS